MVATQMYTLFEHAVGYALFRVKEYEEISSQIPKVEKACVDYINFKNVVQLVGYQPHKSGNSALENTINISDGEIHPDLSLFLETNLPKSTKKCQVILGVSDPKIGTVIQDQFKVTCQHTDIVPEILRGVRLHVEKLIDSLDKNILGSSEAGLARSFSRTKVKFNINRADNMIIQSISLLDQLDKDINTFSMRLREWYSYHFPELVKIVPDNYVFSQVVQAIGDRKQIDEDDLLPKLMEILGDDSLCNSILSAARTSMGMDISPVDLINIATFSKKVINLAEYRRQLMEYLQSRMHNVAPNLSALIGETVGARLISHAGSLINLAKYPASTVQILGAEKALFRALKTRGNTPKHGLLFHSSYISRAGARNKGRISRFLANKCSIASRIDCFADKPLEVFGTHLKEQVEERLTFYETGTIPKKNLDVMKEAGEKASQLLQERAERKKAKSLKKKLKKQAKLQEETNNDENNENDETVIADTTIPDEADIVDASELPVEPSKKAKKRKRSKNVSEEIVEENGNAANQDEANETIDDNANSSAKKKKKKNKKQKVANDNN